MKYLREATNSSCLKLNSFRLPSYIRILYRNRTNRISLSYISIHFLISVSIHQAISVDTYHFSVISDSSKSRGLQQARLPCTSLPPGVYSNSCPLSRQCHPTISSSVIPFSSRLQSFPASGSFPMSQLFASGGQSIGMSASASFLPMNIQGIFR